MYILPVAFFVNFDVESSSPWNSCHINPMSKLVLSRYIAFVSSCIVIYLLNRHTKYNKINSSLYITELKCCFFARTTTSHEKPLRWRHNGCDSVSNRQPHHCLLNRLFRRRSKKTSKLRVTGLCVVNSPGTGEFSAQMASNAEKVSIWWRHHANMMKWHCGTYDRLFSRDHINYLRPTRHFFEYLLPLFKSGHIRAWFFKLQIGSKLPCSLRPSPPRKEDRFTWIDVTATNDHGDS